jgi:4-carboxymuconolactone decarboxylase
MRDKVIGAGLDGVEPAPGHAAFIEFSVQHLWGGAWLDDTLDLRTRSLCTMTALMALGHDNTLRLHIIGALHNKFYTPVELRAIVLHIAPYVGYPVASHAMRLVDEVVAARAATGAEQ